MSFNIFYKIKENGSFRYYNSETDDIKTVNKIELTHNFEIPNKGYCKKSLIKKNNRYKIEESIDDDCLINYISDFKHWIKELRYDKIHSFRYTNYFTDIMASVNFFMKHIDFKLKDCPQIKRVEMEWIESAPNGALMYCIEEQTEPIDTYSYDFNMHYATCLGKLEDSNLMIPTSEGYETTLDELPKKSMNLSYGFYRVKITSDNPNAKKVFVFSKKNTYNYYSLFFAMKHKKQFNFKIELIQDGKPNAYLYDNMIQSSEYFGEWYNTLLSLKKKYPKNKLIKMLASNLWGGLAQTNTKNVSEDELDKYVSEGYQIRDKKEYGDPDDSDHKIYYEIYHPDNFYKYNIRIKSWLNAYARNKTAYLAMTDLDNVIRIHTDSVSFRTEHEHNERYKFEDKTSGRVIWYNVNNYYKVG
jgi:hypothetical protein